MLIFLFYIKCISIPKPTFCPFKELTLMNIRVRLFGYREEGRQGTQD